MVLTPWPNTALDIDAAVSTSQLLRVLLPLWNILNIHIMYRITAGRCHSGIEDHASVCQIRVIYTFSDNTEHVGVSLKLSAVRLATTLHSGSGPGSGVTFITPPSRMFWHYQGRPKSLLVVSDRRRRGRWSDTAC